MSIYFQKTFQRGFGTFPLQGVEAKNALNCAIETGYRAIDTAQWYGNEAEVGQVIAASNVPREEFCITTKVLPANFSREAFMPSVEQSLRDLQVDQFDVLLLHWPEMGGDNQLTLELLQDAYNRGYAQNIGVSNYNVAMLKQAQSALDVPIAVNQVEFHPLLDQSVLLEGASALGVPLSSYCSVARGAIFDLPDFAEIGMGYDRSAAQVALRWILQKGVALNTMSTKPSNICANFDVMDFVLSNVDMARIDKISKRNKRLVTRDVCPFAPDWD